MIGSPDPELIERFRRDVTAIAPPMQTGDSCAVAVSGGPDSLALLLLADAAFPCRIAAVSIDHGLRTEATAECAFVGEVCAALGVPHETVPVSVEHEGEGVQAAARKARLLAFGDWCRRTRTPWMMTGHHADDQAETVLMRLARGAGVAGLSAIDTTARLPGPGEPVATLLRPLLGWTRAELAAIVRVAGLTPIDDPSNADPRYDRTRVRALLAGADLLDSHRLAATASHCGDADRALAWAVTRLEERHLRMLDDRAELDIAPLEPWHREIMRRLLLDIFAHFDARPRGAEIMRLLDLLHAGRPATLAGIKATPGPVWTFAPAPPRRSP